MPNSLPSIFFFGTKLNHRVVFAIQVKELACLHSLMFAEDCHRRERVRRELKFSFNGEHYRPSLLFLSFLFSRGDRARNGFRVPRRLRAAIVYFYVYRRRYEISFPIVFHVRRTARYGSPFRLRLYLDGPGHLRHSLLSCLAARKGRSSPDALSVESRW